MSAALRLIDKRKTVRVSTCADSKRTAGSSPRDCPKMTKATSSADLEPSESPPATSAVSQATVYVLSTVATIPVDSLLCMFLALPVTNNDPFSTATSQRTLFLTEKIERFSRKSKRA
jgi:hypothetical protein